MLRSLLQPPREALRFFLKGQELALETFCSEAEAMDRVEKMCATSHFFAFQCESRHGGQKRRISFEAPTLHACIEPAGEGAVLRGCFMMSLQHRVMLLGFWGVFMIAGLIALLSAVLIILASLPNFEPMALFGLAWGLVSMIGIQLFAVQFHLLALKDIDHLTARLQLTLHMEETKAGN